MRLTKEDLKDDMWPSSAEDQAQTVIAQLDAGEDISFATLRRLTLSAIRHPCKKAYKALQVLQGLSSPATAIALLGKGGAVLMLILLFMAVASSTSAQMIAVSCKFPHSPLFLTVRKTSTANSFLLQVLLTFDVYKTYMCPASSHNQPVKISHYSIILYALILASFCSVLNAVGINLSWLETIPWFHWEWEAESGKKEYPPALLPNSAHGEKDEPRREWSVTLHEWSEAVVEG